eukprot:1724474-Rhodomonas_salina.2
MSRVATALGRQSVRAVLDPGTRLHARYAMSSTDQRPGFAPVRDPRLQLANVQCGLQCDHRGQLRYRLGRVQY